MQSELMINVIHIYM